MRSWTLFYQECFKSLKHHSKTVLDDWHLNEMFIQIFFIYHECATSDILHTNTYSAAACILYYSMPALMLRIYFSWVHFSPINIFPYVGTQPALTCNIDSSCFSIRPVLHELILSFLLKMDKHFLLFPQISTSKGFFWSLLLVDLISICVFFWSPLPVEDTKGVEVTETYPEIDATFSSMTAKPPADPTMVFFTMDYGKFGRLKIERILCVSSFIRGNV